MPPTLADVLRAEPFTLAMSSGFFGFFAHAGFVAALEEEALQPAAYAGSSAGALVGACHASGLRTGEIADVFFALKRDDFWDPRRLPLGGGLLRGKLFRARLRSTLKHSFEEAAPIAISVFDVGTARTQVLRSGDLPLAVHASCAVPFMFEPVWRNGRPLLDGGIRDRPGLEGVKPNERVLYHHLASRSPWRSRKGMTIPRRPNLHAVAITGLPRLGPSQLTAGPAAFHAARAAGLQALRSPAMTHAVVAA